MPRKRFSHPVKKLAMLLSLLTFIYSFHLSLGLVFLHVPYICILYNKRIAKDL